MQDILRRHRRNVALVVGNGVNRYRNRPVQNDWRALLQRLSNRHLAGSPPIPDDLALTEFFDVLELKVQGLQPADLQKEFCSLMRGWTPRSQHRRIVEWAIENGNPILTTNFENVLGEAAGCELRSMFQAGRWASRPTDFYPWESYYGREDLQNPCSGFGVWHINGMQCYPRSIRLSLTHYMGSVARARGWIHGRHDSSIFRGKDTNYWRGYKTWLHVLFNRPLLIFGIALEENEVFLRWLLIERARYFRQFHERRHPAWYVCRESSLPPGKDLFLRSIGVRPVLVPDYDAIYSEAVWA